MTILLQFGASLSVQYSACMCVFYRWFPRSNHPPVARNDFDVLWVFFSALTDPYSAGVCFTFVVILAMRKQSADGQIGLRISVVQHLTESSFLSHSFSLQATISLPLFICCGYWQARKTYVLVCEKKFSFWPLKFRNIMSNISVIEDQRTGQQRSISMFSCWEGLNRKQPIWEAQISVISAVKVAVKKKKKVRALSLKDWRQASSLLPYPTPR